MDYQFFIGITLWACKYVKGNQNSHNSMLINNPNVFLTHARNIFGPSQKILLNRRFNSTEDLYPRINPVKFKIPQSTKENRLRETRHKRGALHLYNMIYCSTGCNPLIYKGYGCFCGFLGAGYPVDGIDRCCKKHDWCYNVANCPAYLEYLVPYFWKCWTNRPFCAIEHGEFGGPGSCSDRLCECDRAFSECLRKYPCPMKRAFCKSSSLRFLQNAVMLFT